MNAYGTSGWENFFVAEAGASAALSGLLFVAVSINLARILSLPTLPSRAGRALLLLLAVLFVATLGLVPGQPRVALAGELLGVGAVVWGAALLVELRSPANPHITRLQRIMTVALVQLATLPLLAAGVSLAVGAGGGLYWLVPFTMFAVMTAVFDAWVLLVEIMR